MSGEVEDVGKMLGEHPTYTGARSCSREQMTLRLRPGRSTWLSQRKQGGLVSGSTGTGHPAGLEKGAVSRAGISFKPRNQELS